MANPLHQLEALAQSGLQPLGRQVWLGLGFRPPKRCAIQIDPSNVPSVANCKAVVGLDVIVTYHGQETRYGPLRALCGALVAAPPRRLQVIDLDARKIAYLKLEAS